MGPIARGQKQKATLGLREVSFSCVVRAESGGGRRVIFSWAVRPVEGKKKAHNPTGFYKAHNPTGFCQVNRESIGHERDASWCLTLSHTPDQLDGCRHAWTTLLEASAAALIYLRKEWPV